MAFFKAYDMRGTFGADFDIGTVFRVGRALPQVVPGPRWLVGRDCRTTSPDISAALIDGLTSAGADVTDLGPCTTPMTYFFTAEDDYDGSVMVTASHNPPSDNGLKVSSRGARPVGYANGLDRVERLVATGDGTERAAGGRAPAKPAADALSRYLDWMRGRTPDLSGLHYAVDCSCGMASLLAKDLFPDAEIINDTPDGRFPAHSPNPLKAEAREQIAALVREKGLDAGIVFDGDADRCMFVDETGAFVQPDYLIPVVAAACGAGRGDRVIHDVRTSRGAIDAIRRLGAEPIMVPVGHAFAKPALRESGAVCGGELAGHYYFRDFHCCDSGALAALKVLGEVTGAKRKGLKFSEMMKPISSAYANSGELNFKVEDKDAAIGRVLAALAAEWPAETDRSEMDGVRVEFPDGWVSIRKSNTEPYLRLVAECAGAERLASWTKRLSEAIDDR
ncbi:MAG: phosphomannomutase/phosphoglucomutase [Kiritimatiellae bacterium]|nr:phosphomannomutase/phosphoglucomutase [Kiritimatiellia bacterium]